MLSLRTTLLGVLLLGLASGLAQAETAPRTVRIATEGAYPPFNYIENGEPAGFEVDLGRAVCAAAKLECRFVLHQWDGIIKALEAGEYDAIMSSLAITAKRKARIGFTRPYYRIPTSLLVAKDGDLKGIDAASLKGRQIGVAEGSDAEKFLAERRPGATAHLFGTVADADLDLAAGRLDGVLADKRTLAAFAATPEGGCCRIAADVPPGEPLLGEGVGIGVRKDDGALRDALDAGIAAVMADGTYDRIRAKYLPFDTK